MSCISESKFVQVTTAPGGMCILLWCNYGHNYKKKPHIMIMVVLLFLNTPSIAVMKGTRWIKEQEVAGYQECGWTEF